MQHLIANIKSTKEVSVCVVNCLVTSITKKDTTSTLLTTSVTSSRHTGVMFWLWRYYRSSEDVVLRV